MKKILYILIIVLPYIGVSQNVSINKDGLAPDPSAMLDVSDTASGVLVPRMTMTQRDLIVNPATGLLIFQTDLDSGFYFNQGTSGAPIWLRIQTTADSNYWSKKDTNLYYNSGSVGIGTDVPEATLHLYGKGSLGAGARIVFGDDYRSTTNQWNSFVGESGWDSNTDSDQLQIHGRQGQFFTIGTPSATLDTAMMINSGGAVTVGDSVLGGRLNIGASNTNFIRMHSDSGQTGLWVSNDSAEWAIFSEAKSGSVLPQGGVGLFTVPSGLAWSINREGNMGIRTDSAESTMDIRSSGIDEPGIMSVGNSDRSHFVSIFGGRQSDPNPFIMWKEGDPLRFATDESTYTEKMRLTTEGNLGIGTTSPAQQIDVIDTGVVAIRLGGDQTDKFLMMDYNNDQAFSSIQSGSFGGTTHPLILQGGGGNIGIGSLSPALKLSIGPSDDDTGFETNSDGNLSLFTNGTERVRFDENGNVGIGLTSPGDKVTIFDGTSPTLRLTSSTNSTFSNDVNSGRIEFTETGTDFETSGTGFQLGYDGLDNKFRIKKAVGGTLDTVLTILRSNGYIGIGQDAPVAPFEIAQQSGDVGMIITEDVEIGVYTGDDFEIAHVNTSGVVQDKRFTIQSDGDVIVYEDLRVDGTFSNPSDERLKIGIQPIENTLEKILSLRGIYYYWDTLKYEHRGFSSKRTIGLIAQDLQKVFPELIVEDEEGFLSVDYPKFTAVLLQAIKEQQVLIDQQVQNNEKQQYQIDNLQIELKELKSLMNK